MSWIQLILRCHPDMAERCSALLSELGAQAVTLRDGADQPLYEPPLGTTPLWRDTEVTGLFEQGVEPDELIEQIGRALEPQPLPAWSCEKLDDQPWERAWMDDFQPMCFGQRLWIIPSWTEPPEPQGVNIELDPGLAFGTGTHPTTRLCLEWLDGAAIDGRVVVDYGCGSGVLAIAAAKLGARTVWGVDNDPQALQATVENGHRNGVADRVTTVPPEKMPEIKAEIIIANILAGPLIELAPRFAELLTKGGTIVLTGILEEQEQEVTEIYSNGFEMAEPKIEEGWVLLYGRRY